MWSVLQQKLPYTYKLKLEYTFSKKKILPIVEVVMISIHLSTMKTMTIVIII